MKTLVTMTVLTLVGCSKPASPAKRTAPLAEHEPPHDRLEAADDRLARAEDLIATWAGAQQALDFDAYIALYADDFEWIQRSANDREVSFDLAEWREEREPMFDDRMEVSIENVHLAPNEPDQVIATVTERHRRRESTYHGMKRLVLDLSGEEGRIVREEMVWVREGWRDHPADPIDATGMASPLTVEVDSTPVESSGDCLGNYTTLRLTATGGPPKEISLGEVTEHFDGDVTPTPGIARRVAPSASKQALYQLGGDLCQGFRVSLTVRRRGDRLEVVNTWIIEEEGPGESTSVELAALLPPGAELEVK